MEIFIAIFIFIVVILLTRLFGAWMLRINDVIDELKGLREDIKFMERRFKQDSEIEEKKCPMCAEVVNSEALVCKHCKYQFPEPEEEEEEEEEEILNEEMVNNTDVSAPSYRKIIIYIATAVLIIASITIYILSFVDFTEAWRQPTSVEESKLNNVINQYEVACKTYYVKKINYNEYYVACTEDGSKWDYREVIIDSEKIYLLSPKIERNLKEPE
ncbi:hypothetical protein QWY87_13600 [Lutimonas halocynthiae]|uniref:hypothetical protein n=1 Tax=Lutimonas halocynthiae TaxID=1446477 RepID=UPI0025B4E05B|nr:hypothetical protein [Lutimonas halocynthiae]MDN3643746.1 hypothetical protein [Lutimonas halocynthiae]